MIHRRRVVLGVAASLAAARSIAQTFPARPLVLVVPYPPGGPGDLMARSVGQVVAERLGQPVLVENRPGAGGQIAGTALVRAPADGYTLMLGDTSTLGINMATYKQFSWNPPSDVRGVAPLLVMPAVLVVPASSPYHSVAELVAASKSRDINFASQGAGTAGHVLGELLRDAAVGKFVHVPYKGSAPAMGDLLGGQVDMLFEGIGPALPHLRSGKLRCLAVAGPVALPQLPGVPTMAQLGYRGVELSIWFGVVVRAQTPDAVVEVLNKELVHAISQPAVRRRFEDLGFQFLEMPAAQFTHYIRSEAQHWGKFVRARQISAD